MKNLILFCVFFAFALSSQAQVIDSLTVSPCDTAEGINVDMVIYHVYNLEHINHVFSINDNEIDLSICYYRGEAPVVDWDTLSIHITAPPEEYNLNIMIHSSLSIDTCSYYEMTDSTTIPISTLGVSPPSSEKDLASMISVFPNPANDFISIESANCIQIKSMTLFDMLGKKISEIQNSESKIELNQIKSGVYILQIDTNMGRLVKRIVRE